MFFADICAISSILWKCFKPELQKKQTNKKEQKKKQPAADEVMHSELKELC